MQYRLVRGDALATARGVASHPRVREASSIGTVYLVGAGPGDPGLLTVRALELLQHADAVLHDHLVSPAVLARCRRGALVIDVGKIGHGSRTEQRDIEGRLVALAHDYRTVVRLKGGDPFLFGRGAEEAAALTTAGVPFEVVPGVSSALAVPAAAGIPLTLRGTAQSVAIATGHCAGPSSHLPSIPSADTVVVLMGVARAAAIASAMIASGRDPDTPAAAIERGTCPDQRVVVATLATLADAIARERIAAPAVLVIGETVRTREWLIPNRFPRARFHPLNWLDRSARPTRLFGCAPPATQT